MTTKTQLENTVATLTDENDLMRLEIENLRAKANVEEGSFDESTRDFITGITRRTTLMGPTWDKSVGMMIEGNQLAWLHSHVLDRFAGSLVWIVDQKRKDYVQQNRKVKALTTSTGFDHGTANEFDRRQIHRELMRLNHIRIEGEAVSQMQNALATQYEKSTGEAWVPYTERNTQKIVGAEQVDADINAMLKMNDLKVPAPQMALQTDGVETENDHDEVRFS